MTDEPTPTEVTTAPVPTLEEALAELQQIDAWLQDLAQRKAQEGALLIRAGELRGVVATHQQYAQPAPPNRAERRAAKKPTKRTTPSSRAKG